MITDSLDFKINWSGHGWAGTDHIRTDAMAVAGAIFGSTSSRIAASEDAQLMVSKYWNSFPNSDYIHTLSVPQATAPKLSRPRFTTDDVQLLEKLDGFVSEILPDGFKARFDGLDCEGHPVIAEFAFDELTESDQAILSQGMPVVWCIYRERSKGAIRRSSTIYLRRQTAPVDAEITAAADALHEWFGASSDTASRR